MRLISLLILLLPLSFCGGNPAAFDDAYLNDVLTISRIGKRTLQDTDAGQISALVLDLQVDNRSDMSVYVPFRMTWTLMERDGTPVGIAVERFPEGISAGGSVRFQLKIELGASRLNNHVDEMVFEVE